MKYFFFLVVLVAARAQDCVDEAEVSFLQLELARAEPNQASGTPEASTKLAQEAAIWPIWPQDQAPTDSNFEKILNQESTETFAYLNTTYLVPPQTPGRADVVLIVVPGGGGLFVDGSEGEAVAMWSQSVGISAVMLKYRVPDKTNGQLELSCESLSYVPMYDLQRAVALVRSRLDSLGVSHVGVIGSSWGGYIFSTILMTSKLMYQAVDAIDTDFDHVPDFGMLNYPCFDKCLGIIGDLPPAIPVLIQHGMSDTTCPWQHSTHWAEWRQNATGYINSTEIIIYPHAGHLFDASVLDDPNVTEEEAGWGKAASRFMKFNLGFDIYPNSPNIVKP